MKYPKEVEQLHKEIKEIKIQGATNVAISTFKGMKSALRTGFSSSGDLLEDIVDVGKYLAYARPNEPLAQNGVLCV